MSPQNSSTVLQVKTFFSLASQAALVFAFAFLFTAVQCKDQRNSSSCSIYTKFQPPPSRVPKKSSRGEKESQLTNNGGRFQIQHASCLAAYRAPYLHLHNRLLNFTSVPTRSEVSGDVYRSNIET
mmetsp:Transcript_12796/g.23838  ORF Transcript_12796/g.23838 Transcript_12796/m.23838 type:complete len:125 (+) Transcript_12796:938-1312(+)